MSLLNTLKLIHQIGGNMNTVGKVESTYDPNIYEWTAPSQKGWECPRCGQIWAPWVSNCDCNKKNNYVTTTTTDKTKPIPLEINSWKKYVTCKMGQDSCITVGGSDYYDSNSKTYKNVPYTYTNTIERS